MVLEIVFTGLIAFVRHSCEVKPDQQMHILMVEGAKYAHEPRMVVAVEDLAPSEPDKKLNVPDEIIPGPDGIQYAVWHLNGYRIKLEGLVPPIQIREGGRAKIPSIARDKSSYLDEYDQFKSTYPAEYYPPEQSNDFGWVPELHRACYLPTSTGQVQKDRRVKKAVLDPTELKPLAVARFDPINVELTTNPQENYLEGILDEPKKEDVFGFPGVKVPYTQVASDRVRLKLTLPFAPFEIGLYNAKGVLQRKIRFKPKGNAGTVAISVSNLPPHIEDEHAHGDKRPNHFGEYYKLLEYKKPDKCPEPEPTHPDYVGVHPVKCMVCSACGCIPGVDPDCP